MTIRLLLCVAAVLFGATTQYPSRAALSWRFPSEISLHAPLTPDLVLTNNSAQEVSLFLGAEGVDYLRFDVLGPDGKHQYVRPQFGEGPVGAEGLRAKAGERAAVTIHLSKWLDLEDVGEYSIGIHFEGMGLSAGLKYDWDEHLKVVPRDPEGLRRTCATLLHQAVGQDLGVAEYASRDLAFIRDPVAVPFLVEAAHGSYYFPLAIDGLGQIAGRESTAALQQLAADPDQKLAKKAQAVLARRK